MAFPIGWGRKCVITIPAAHVGGTGSLSGYPVRLTESNLPSEMFDRDGSYPALDGGGDIRFSADAGGVTQLPCQIVEFVTDDNPANGRAVVYVTADVDGTTDTDIYVWYSKGGEIQPAATDPYGSQAVWDSNFQAVFVSPIADGLLPDSTSNGRDLSLGDISGRTRVYLAEYDAVETAVPDVHQGLDYDGSIWYMVDTNALYRHTSLSTAAVTSNTDPCGDTGDATCNHLGDPKVHGDYLYVPVGDWNSCVDFNNQYIARYNKDTLAYVDKWDVTAQGHDVAGLTVDPDAGPNGEIYVVSYCDATKIWRYDLSDGSYLGAIPLGTSNKTDFQGVALLNGFLLVSCSDGANNSIVSFSVDGTYHGEICESWPTRASVAQGLSVHDGWLYWWDGGTSERLLKFQTPWDKDRRILLGGDFSANTLTYTLPDSGTISLFAKPKSFYNYNTLWDNSVDGNDWECWFYADRRFGARVDGIPVTHTVASGSEDTTQQLAFAWSRLAGNVDQEIFTDGAARANNTVAWVTPGSAVQINGGHPGNTTGRAHFERITISNVVRSDAWMQTEYNNVLSGASFAVEGAPESTGGGGVDLTVQDSAHSLASETPALLQGFGLLPAGGIHAHTAESPTLLVSFTLAPADSVHAHTAESPTLLVSFTLAPADSVHAHTVESPTMSAGFSLAANDAAHAHGVESPAISQSHVVAVADAAHGHSAAAVVVSVEGTLRVQGAEHAHIADAPDLVQAATIAVQDAAHAHQADAVVVSLQTFLGVQGAEHMHTAAAVGLSQSADVSVADALHAHFAENVGLVTASTLIISGALHAHIVANPHLIVGTLETPNGVVYLVRAEVAAHLVN